MSKSTLVSFIVWFSCFVSNVEAAKCAKYTLVKYAEKNCTGMPESTIAVTDGATEPSDFCLPGPFDNEPEFNGAIEGTYCNTTSGKVFQTLYLNSSTCDGDMGVLQFFSEDTCLSGYSLQEACSATDCEGSHGTTTGSALMIATVTLMMMVLTVKLL